MNGYPIKPKNLRDCVTRSIRHNEIVEWRIDREEIDQTLLELATYADGIQDVDVGEEYGYVDVWGWNEGMEDDEMSFRLWLRYADEKAD